MKWLKRFLPLLLLCYLFIASGVPSTLSAQETPTEPQSMTVSERLKLLMQSLDELERLSMQQASDLSALSEELAKYKTEIQELSSLLTDAKTQSADLWDTLQKCKARLQIIEQRVLLWQIIAGVEAGAIIVLLFLYFLKQ